MTGLMDSKKVSPPGNTIIGPTIPSDMKREDGSMKGLGYMGPLSAGGGKTATEKSIGVEINGKEISIPSLVPTLTKDEAKFVATTEKPPSEWPKEIIMKARKHATERMKSGKSPFASDADYPKTIIGGSSGSTK